MKNALSNSSGILLSTSIAIIAYLTSPYLPVGAVVIAIIIGMLVGNTVMLKDTFQSGIKFSESSILALSIGLMGVNLNFRILKDIGIETILLVVAAMIFTILFTIAIGKLFKSDNKFALLLGIGSAVCGSSAIAATDKIIKAEQKDVGLSIAIVNFLGTIGVFLIPLFAGLIVPFDNLQAGIFAGNTLQAVGQAVAAGFSISEESGNIATLVKMTRVLMLLPVSLIIAMLFAKSKSGDLKSKRPRIPLFVIGFALTSVIASLHILPDVIIEIISKISSYLLIIAMAAIGLNIRTKNILNDGKQALGIGSIVFLIQIIFSWLLITFLF
jgi:uncharacterized integral membrane protein (TIGR00698 family)